MVLGLDHIIHLGSWIALPWRKGVRWEGVVGYRIDNTRYFCEVQHQVTGGNGHKWERRHYKENMLKRRDRKYWNTLSREVVESAFLENFHNPAGQGPEQSALSSPLVSLHIQSLYRWPPQLIPKLHFFYDAMILFWGLWPSYSHCSCEPYPYLFSPKTYPNSLGTGCLGKQFLYCCSFLELHLAYVCILSGNYASSEVNFFSFVYMS